MTSVRAVLEELHLLKCSLLPGELLYFTEDSIAWESLLDAYSLDPDAELSPTSNTARLAVRAEDSDVWFEVELPEGYKDEGCMPRVAVKGDTLRRADQERWQTVVAEAMEEVRSSEYPLFELISSHLLPRLHADATQREDETAGSAGGRAPAPTLVSDSPSPRYHALFTSHHLKSPSKRRSLSQWSHELSLSGFTKVGYPGVIYCEGARQDVEDFVARVKGMQWLALRLRFIEAILEAESQTGRDWVEFEKVGEVVEEMRRRGRESFVVEMGIGSAGAPPASSK